MTADGGEGKAPVAYFDTLVGTDSHTPTANGIGVLGWGVGGIEAEAAALGQPITTLVPRVVGVRLTGELSEGVAAMDVALTFAQMLREKGVVGSFVECFGPGLASLNATQRTCISNMTPEYGSTCTLFPVDGQTLDYLRLTGRSEEQVALVEAYAKAQGFWNDPEAPERIYAEVVELDLGEVERSLAGPSRPHDRIPLAGAQKRFQAVCAERGLDDGARARVELGGETCELGHGAIAIAAVTSCTTATDPRMMLACGLVAQKAAAAGLAPKPWVKTILAPGSKATELLLERAGLMEGLRKLGFHTCGFGCMSCIGNSGPIAEELHAVADKVELASVLSGNRNFEGRISPDVSQNYLAAPAMVVAYALAGTMDIDLAHDALGAREDGVPVYLADIWPTDAEVDALVASCVDEDLYAEGTRGLYDGDARWQALGKEPSATFAWDDASTYVRRAPYFDGMTREPSAARARGGRARAGAPWRLHHDGPHLACRLHRRGFAGGALPGGARRGPGRLQHLRRASRQPRGDDARHVRQCEAAKLAGRRKEGRLDARLRHGRGSASVRCGHDVRRSGRAACGGGRQDVRQRIVARLGGEGAGASGHPRGVRGELRAHSSQQPHRYGHFALAVPGGYTYIYWA